MNKSQMQPTEKPAEMPMMSASMQMKMTTMDEKMAEMKRLGMPMTQPMKDEMEKMAKTMKSMKS